MMKAVDWLLNNAGKILSAIALVAFASAWIMNALPLPDSVAKQVDLEKLQQTVQTLADVTVEGLIAAKEAEIRGIIRKYDGTPPLEAQLTIKSLEKDIKRLKGE